MNQFFQQFDNNLKGYDTQNNLNNNWNWNYFEEDKKQKSPSKSFNVNEFMNTDFYNKNDMRVDGNKTNRFDTDGTMNTNFTQTTYSVKDEGLHTTANGTKWNGNKREVYRACALDNGSFHLRIMSEIVFTYKRTEFIFIAPGLFASGIHFLSSQIDSMGWI